MPLEISEHVDEKHRSRRSREEKNSSVKTRAPSLPQLSNNREYEISDKRSQSMIENTKRVIPDIVKQSPSAHPRLHSDKEDPCDDSDRLESLLSPHPDDSDDDRNEAYETISRSESITDLRNIGRDIKKEKQSGGYDSKVSSLASLGLSKLKHKTMFDKIEDDQKDDKAPGAFKNPQAALSTAIEDLKSENWQIEVGALSAIVRISVWNPELITSKMSKILDLVKHELRNPRSQVCKVAAQTFTKLFSLFSKHIEKEKIFEDVVKALLLRTGDTNKFIRIDASDALDTMAENVSVHKAVSILVTCGLHSKNVMIRVCVSFLLLHVVKTLGPETFFKSSKDTVDVVLRSTAELLEDGSQDVR